MDPIEEYLATLERSKAEYAGRLLARVPALVPEAVPGKKYAMACYVYRDRGLIAVIATKSGLSLVPFSGSLNREVAPPDRISDGGGSLWFTVDDPITDSQFDQLVGLRVAEIDRARGPKKTLKSI